MSDVDTARVAVGPEGWGGRDLGGWTLSEHALDVLEAEDEAILPLRHLVARNQLLRHKSRSLNLS